MSNAHQVFLDVADETEEGCSSHSLGSGTTSLSQQDLKVLIDKWEEVREQKQTVMWNLKKDMETFEKRKVAARIALVTAAVVTNACAVALTFRVPNAAGVAAVSLTFLQFLLQLIEGIFRDHRRKLQVKMETLGTGDLSVIFNEIAASVEKMKVEFQSQEESTNFTLMAMEIMKKMENFARILKEVL